MKFSIITCTYNSEKYIKDNIKSVKNQTYRNFEHIFIDGFSTDNTIKIIKKYQKEFPNKVKLFQFPAKGISNAMNHGIEKSKGEYLIHLHSDDSFYDNRVSEDVADFLKRKNNPNWIYGKANFINKEKNKQRIIPHRKIYEKTRFWLLLLTNYIPHQAVFIKKELFDKYGYFDESFKNAMDYELWIRLTKNNINGTFFDRIICNFSVRQDSQSSINKQNQDHKKIFEIYLSNKMIIKIFNWIKSVDKKRDII